MAGNLSREHRRLILFAAAGMGLAILLIGFLAGALTAAGSCWACGW